MNQEFSFFYMGCELSKSAKGKAPRYKTVAAKNSISISRRFSPVPSGNPKVPSSMVGTVRSERDPQDLPIETDQSSSSGTELLLEPLKDLVVFDEINEADVIVTIPADHAFEDREIHESGPLEHLPKSMFDDEVLVALATFEREHMLRKDFEFEAILAQVQGA